MHVIYVDDEMPAINNFRLTTAEFAEIRELHTFQDGAEALAYAGLHTVDVAFLDMEMPGIHGLDLARELKSRFPGIRVVFVTAYGQYALDAFGVDATGYLLKPYTAFDIHKELAKCAWRSLPSHRMVIETMPTLQVLVDGVPLTLSGAKPREMLALLVDRGERGFSVGEGIACLWPDRPADAKTKSLCRMTWKRLVQALESFGVGDLVYTADNRRHIKTDAVECDLYRILSGDRQAAGKYDGNYLSEYDWADESNVRIRWAVRQAEQHADVAKQ